MLDLRMLLQAVRRHKVIFGVAVALGLIAGAAFAAISPPMMTSKVLVILPGTRFIQTEAVIAGSDPVLAAAGRSLSPALSAETLRHRVQITTVTSTVLSVAATGTTDAVAQNTANAVAHSYVDLIGSPNSPDGRVPARILESATPATGTTLRTRIFEDAAIGALLGALLGAIIAVAIGRADRRLRRRDQIADAVGAPVLASVPVAHPADAAGWTRLLAGYKPGVVHAWGLRKALRHLGVADLSPASGADVILAVVSLSSDRRALAAGPQLAAFAASLGIPTTLVIARPQIPQATAALSAACASRSGDPGYLQLAAAGDQDGQPPGALLTVVVVVLDSANPQLASPIAPNATLLAVTAGAVTAEQLARAAASITGDGCSIAGVLVADPDPADRTTGRLPELGQHARPGSQPRPRQPAEMASTASEPGP